MTPSGTFGCAIADKNPYDYLRVSCSKSIEVLSMFSPGLYWTGIFGDSFSSTSYTRFRLYTTYQQARFSPTLLVTGGAVAVRRLIELSSNLFIYWYLVIY